MEKPLRFQAKREMLQQLAPYYRQAPVAQKRTLLDAFVATTGYHRTYARWLLNHAEEVQHQRAAIWRATATPYSRARYTRPPA